MNTATTATTTVHTSFEGPLQVERAIVTWEAREGGAWTYERFGGVWYVHRTPRPTEAGTYYRGAWTR